MASKDIIIVVAGEERTYDNVQTIECKLASDTSQTAKYVEVSDTTAVAADVAKGKLFYTANGTLDTGTNEGGSPTPVPVRDGRPIDEPDATALAEKIALSENNGVIYRYTGTAGQGYVQQGLYMCLRDNEVIY